MEKEEMKRETEDEWLRVRKMQGEERKQRWEDREGKMGVEEVGE